MWTFNCDWKLFTSLLNFFTFLFSFLFVFYFKIVLSSKNDFGYSTSVQKCFCIAFELKLEDAMKLCTRYSSALHAIVNKNHMDYGLATICVCLTFKTCLFFLVFTIDSIISQKPEMPRKNAVIEKWKKLDKFIGNVFEEWKTHSAEFDK